MEMVVEPMVVLQGAMLLSGGHIKSNQQEQRDIHTKEILEGQQVLTVMGHMNLVAVVDIKCRNILGMGSGRLLLLAVVVVAVIIPSVVMVLMVVGVALRGQVLQ